MKERKNDWLTELMNERMDGWMDGWMDEWMSMEHWWSNTDGRETQAIGEPPVPVSHYAAEITHKMTRDPARASAIFFVFHC
jgi:hypothetical protein